MVEVQRSIVYQNWLKKICWNTIEECTCKIHRIFFYQKICSASNHSKFLKAFEAPIKDIMLTKQSEKTTIWFQKFGHMRSGQYQVYCKVMSQSINNSIFVFLSRRCDHFGVTLLLILGLYCFCCDW